MAASNFLSLHRLIENDRSQLSCFTLSRTHVYEILLVVFNAALQTVKQDIIVDIFMNGVLT